MLLNTPQNFVSGLLAHSVIKSQQMATGIAGKPAQNGVAAQNGGKAKSPPAAPAKPANVPPPPCAPYCPKPGQVSGHKQGSTRCRNKCVVENCLPTLVENFPNFADGYKIKVCFTANLLTVTVRLCDCKL